MQSFPLFFIDILHVATYFLGKVKKKAGSFVRIAFYAERHFKIFKINALRQSLVRIKHPETVGDRGEDFLRYRPGRDGRHRQTEGYRRNHRFVGIIF